MISLFKMGILILLLSGFGASLAVASTDYPATSAGQVPNIANEDEESLPDFSFTFPHILVGASAGRVTPARPLERYTGSGLQVSGWLLKSLWDDGAATSLNFTLSYRYAIFNKSLDAVRDTNASLDCRLSAHNIDALVGGSYLVTPEFLLSADVGPVMQRRTFSIRSGGTSYLGDDYHAGTAFGVLVRIGGRYTLSGDNTAGLHYDWEQGAHLTSARFKYDQKSVDINERQSAWGVDITHAF